jgi:hypothetical protein
MDRHRTVARATEKTSAQRLKPGYAGAYGTVEALP